MTVATELAYLLDRRPNDELCRVSAAELRRLDGVEQLAAQVVWTAKKSVDELADCIKALEEALKETT